MGSNERTLDETAMRVYFRNPAYPSAITSHAGLQAGPSSSIPKKGTAPESLVADILALSSEQLEEQRSNQWTVYSFSMQCQLNEVERVYHYDIQPGELLELHRRGHYVFLSRERYIQPYFDCLAYRAKDKGKGKRVGLSRKGSSDMMNDHTQVHRSLTLKSSRSSLNLKSSTPSPGSRRASVKEGLSFQHPAETTHPQVQSSPSPWNIFEQGPERSKGNDSTFSSLVEGVTSVSDATVAAPFSPLPGPTQQDSRKPRLLPHSSSSSLRHILSFGSFNEDARTGGTSGSTTKWKSCWLTLSDSVLRIWKHRAVSFRLRIKVS
ncbi:uncharacterized protein EI90DRAFT_672401 [Cantharellus anzutake]|uniref:uncharacterized protein n=1 Tax=Cantharellus anzutake TaxID=1750568 RepID=UPI00190805F6|nr:uncharacterized protein EI90DRAFT_672401 [Cantharellus anzutake]KAF8332593.1 hypothetical protein EI90DRAFT_672401 [Cantharellus anzutake]